MTDNLLDIEDELNRLIGLISLVGMAAQELDPHRSRAMSAGIDLAITAVIDLQNRVAELRMEKAA